MYTLSDTFLSDTVLHTVLQIYVLYMQFTSICMYILTELGSCLWKDTYCNGFAGCAANPAQELWLLSCK